MKESRENKVAIEGFPFKNVEAAIKICYDCEISNTFSVDDNLFLLKFSDLYDIEHVKTFVECFLADVISSDNVCSIANASIEFNAEKLRLCCKENLKEFFNKGFYASLIKKIRKIIM
uniref:BTB domain-containing protein n=1 Tax=Panagrolaimus sp. PS1159 TaxID=55785 RepID=A0AC35FRG8_9BILA